MFQVPNFMYSSKLTFVKEYDPVQEVLLMTCCNILVFMMLLAPYPTLKLEGERLVAVFPSISLGHSLHF
jgi:hypothetical protein